MVLDTKKTSLLSFYELSLEFQTLSLLNFISHNFTRAHFINISLNRLTLLVLLIYFKNKFLLYTKILLKLKKKLK